MSEESTGALSGAAAGAQAGMAFGPWGAAIGAVVGGIAGLFGGSKARKARLAGNRGKTLARANEYLAKGLERRALVQGAFAQRAEMLNRAAAESGGLQSSGYLGTRSGMTKDFERNVRFFDSAIADSVAIDAYNKRAGKYASQASTIFGAMSAVAGAVQGMGAASGGGGGVSAVGGGGSTGGFGGGSGGGSFGIGGG